MLFSLTAILGLKGWILINNPDGAIDTEFLHVPSPASLLGTEVNATGLQSYSNHHQAWDVLGRHLSFERMFSISV